jgi:sec-independent protein translocase protein TatA
MSGGEIFLIMLVVLIFFGAEKIPEVARGLGKGLREFKRAADEIKSEITNSTAEIRSEMEDIRSDVRNSAYSAQRELDDMKTEIHQSATEIHQELNESSKDTSHEVYSELKKDDKTGVESHTDKPAQQGHDDELYKGANI